MQQVLARIQDTLYVLKGGTALLFTRNLNRHPTDFDFDSRAKATDKTRAKQSVI